MIRILLIAVPALLASSFLAAALDEDMRNMDLGTFSDQQKPARLSINRPADASLSPREQKEVKGTPKQAAAKVSKSEATQARRKALETEQVHAQQRLKAALKAKDFDGAQSASKQLEIVSGKLRFLK